MATLLVNEGDMAQLHRVIGHDRLGAHSQNFFVKRGVYEKA